MRYLRHISILIAAFALASCTSPQERKDMREATLYAYGPYQFALNMDRIGQRNAAAGIGINALAHQRDLADHRARSITAPNTDTIYSSAILDLTTGPVELTVPEAGTRYVSVMLMDVFTDVFATIGTGAGADPGGRYWIAGPDWIGDIADNITLIRAPGHDAWLLARIFVSGPDDLDAARDVQSRLTLRPLPGTQPTPFSASVEAEPSARTMLNLVNDRLGRSPDHPHTARAAPFDALGIRPGDSEAWDRLTALQKMRWRASFARVEDGLKSALAKRTVQKGWSRAPNDLGRFGTDDATRAAVALIGFGAMSPEDATYYTAQTDADGGPLSGNHAYDFTIQPDAVPVDAFWSISVYAVEGDGRRFFMDNPIDRYSVNSATPGLTANATGAWSLHLSSARPDAEVNWLPVPDEPFILMFRAYRPQSPILFGDWLPPDVERHTAGTTQ